MDSGAGGMPGSRLGRDLITQFQFTFFYGPTLTLPNVNWNTVIVDELEKHYVESGVLDEVAFEKRLAMQVVARVVRARLASSCHYGFHVPSLNSRLQTLEQVQQIRSCHCYSSSSTILCQNIWLSTNRQFQAASHAYIGKKRQVLQCIGLGFAFTGRYILVEGYGPGSAYQVVYCHDEGQKPTKLHLQQNYNVVNVGSGRGSLFVWILKYVWVPSVLAWAVMSGLYYPSSLAISILLILWTTTPEPSSIYAWAEKRRLHEAVKKRLFVKPKEQVRLLSLAAIEASAAPSHGWHNGFLHSFICEPEQFPTTTVIHIETCGCAIFSVARVSTITQHAVILGILGGWWVVYCSHPVRSASAQERMKMSFERKMVELPYDSQDAAEAKIGEIWAWWSNLF